jgi:cytochrome d ubiquinol oxidase subunit I
LSLLATHSLTGQVKGLKAFPPADRPPLIALLFYALRLMVAIGFYLFILMLWSVGVWWRQGLSVATLQARRLLLRAWVIALPLGYIAVEAGWVVREVGRQPWIVYGVMRTSEAASNLPATVVLSSLATYCLLYGILLIAFLVFASRLLRRGPDVTLPVPAYQPAQVLVTPPSRQREEAGPQ